MINFEKCKPDCPECGGNGFIGGDTQSLWACTIAVRRHRKAIDAEMKKGAQKLPNS
jgi:hypothetical protein